MYLRRHILYLLLALTPGVTLYGQEEQDTSGKTKVNIEFADDLTIREEGGREISRLTGNVVLSHDSIFMHCDSAVIYERNTVIAKGNIVIRKGDSLAVFSDTLDYTADESHAVLTGDVVLNHKDQQLWTRKLDFLADSNLAYYDNGATLLNDSLQLTSRRGLYWTNLDEAKFLDSVVVIGEDFSMITDSLRYDMGQNIVYFLTRTVMRIGEAEIYCEDGFYDVGLKRALFSENAQFKKNGQRASAEKIRYDGRLDVIELVGKAKFNEEDLYVSGDSIRYFQESGETVIIGNGWFRDSVREAHGPVLNYNRKTEQFYAVGRSTLQEGEQSLTADLIDYDKVTGEGTAFGNVIWKDTSAGNTIRSDSTIFKEDNGYIEAFGKGRRPMYTTLLDEDTLYLTAVRLVSREIADTSNQGDSMRQFLAYHDVRIFSDGMQGLCDSLAFHDSDSVFRMHYDPIMWSDSTQFTADTIYIHVKNRKLDRAHLISNAMILQELQSSFYNQIKGNMIETVFDSTGAEIETVRVLGNAESVYYVRDEAGAYIGVNEVQSAQIKFNFDKETVDTIQFSGSPTGEMKPMGQVNHNTLRLEGFNWLDVKRPRYVSALF